MIKKQFYAAFALLLLCVFPPALRAATLDFTLTGEGPTYSFQLPSSPSGGSNDFYFTIPNVIVMTDGGGEFAAGVIFFTDLAHGGLEFFRDLPQFTGSQVFSVDQGNPTFLTGDYSLVYSQDDAPYTLIIAGAPPGAAVPEPGSWLLLLIGLVAMAALRGDCSAEGCA